MSERKRKRGRPRSTPVLSYGSEMKMRNSITRVIKKPRYLLDQEVESNHSRSCSPSLSEDRSSSLNSGKGKNKRGYNPDIDDKESEYLYGSDFELEEVSDKEESDYKSGSEGDVEFEEEYEGGRVISDMEDVSMSSFGTNGGTPNQGFFPPSRPQTPIPVWLQDRQYPPFELPKSSDDLLLPRAYVLRAIGIYEVLRHFRTLVRLSPMRFEEFCAALMAEEQSSLLAELHMSLLKALIREEDSQQTHFGPLDQKDSINVIMYFIDALTWPESLRLYVQSDREFHPTLAILNRCNYPHTSLEDRLQVLQFLCDQFLNTSVVREDLLSEGKLRYDDHCRVCHKTGDLLCCDSCSAVYHLDCVDPPLQDIPGEMEDWTCTVCTAHQVDGVTDCLSPMESSGILCRQDPLGYDRHGRKYWFLVRRLVVETETGDLWYYSTRAQLSEVVEMMDPSDLEEVLCAVMRDVGPELRRQMSLTESLTKDGKGSRKSCLETEDDEVEKRIDERKKERLKKEQDGLDQMIEELPIKEEEIKTEVKEEIVEENQESRKESEGVKTAVGGTASLNPVTGLMEVKEEPGVKEEQPEVKEEAKSKESGIKTRTKTGSLVPKQFAVDDLRRRLPVEGDGKDDVKRQADEASMQQMTRSKLAQLNNNAGMYRLGCDGKYKSYVNQYTASPLALNKLQHNEERDKRRHLSHKFSLTPNAEFKWSGIIYGNMESLVSTLRHTILSLEQNISIHLFHPHWAHVRKQWNSAVISAAEPRQFSRVLMWLVACIKPVVFNPVWHDSLGHVRFNRVTALEREEKKKQEKRDKKEIEQPEEPRPLTIIKYTLGLKHQVWKLKGEEYRVHGMWGWQWLSYRRRAPHTPMATVGLRAGGEKYMVPIKGPGGLLKSLSLNPSIYRQLAVKSHTLRPCLLSPNQLREQGRLPGESDHKNEIIIASSSGQQKVEVGVVNLEELFENGLVNVSRALTSRSRFLYPKVAKPGVLDRLLSRRLAQRAQEEKEITNKKCPVPEYGKAEEEEDEIDVENDDSDATLSDHDDHQSIDEIPDSQRSTIHKQRPAGNLLKEVRTLKTKYEALDDVDGQYACYSAVCQSGGRSQCYSPLCLLKNRTREKLVNSVKNYRIVTSKPAPFDEVGAHSPVRLNDSTDSWKGDGGSDKKGDGVSDKKGDIVSDNKKGEGVSDNKKLDGASDTVSSSASSSDATSVNGQNINNTESASADSSQIKAEGSTDSSDGRSSRASSEIKIRMDEDLDETSQGSLENKFSLKNERTQSAETTSGKVYLKKISSETKRVPRKLQTRIPQLSSFRIGKRVGNKETRPTSILVVPAWELRTLARKGGRYYVAGFNHNAKANNVVWPYPCSRPVFKTTWQFRTANMPTLNSASMQLRILWVCLRWDDMQEKGPGDGRKQITTDMEIVQTEILKRKHAGRFLEKTTYLRRKVIIPFDVPKPVREFTPSQRSGLRKRRRAQSPVNTQPQSVEEWIEEEKLDIWEIRFFGERLERAAIAPKKTIGERGETVQGVATPGASPAEIRARMEEQLKIQRANFNQRKALEGTPLTKGGVVKLSICSASTLTTPSGTKLALPASPATKVVQAGSSTIMAVSGQIPLVTGKKIVATRDGRIITVQTTTPANLANSTTGGSGTGGEGAGVSVGSSTIFPVGGPKVQVTAQGNKVIRLQAVGGAGQRMILPRSTTTINTTTNSTLQPAARPPRPVTITTPAATISTTTSSATTTITATPTTITIPATTTATQATTTTQARSQGQQIQIIRLPDGQLQVRGLLEGQQLIQRGDGKFHLINTKNAPTPATPLSPTHTTPTPTPTPAIQVTQQTKPVDKPGVISAQVVKVNGQQVLLKHNNENKQVVTVSAGEAAAAGGVPTLGANRQPITPTSPRIKTMLAPDGTTVKTVMASAAPTQTTAPVLATSTPPTDPPTPTPSQGTGGGGGGSSLTLRVQVRMTEQGPKTIIQGLQPGVGLTKDHIMAIQQQVRNMLAQYKLQVNQLSPVLALTLHVPNKQQPPQQQTQQQQQQQQNQQQTPGLQQDDTAQQTQQQQQVTQPQQVNAAGYRSLLASLLPSLMTPAVITVKNPPESVPGVNSVPELKSPVAATPAGADKQATTPSTTSPKKFVLTQEYIQQTIKSALSREDLAPDIEEKLMQLQKYTTEQTKKDEPTPGTGTGTGTGTVNLVPGTMVSTGVSATAANNTNAISARSAPVKRVREQDDIDWDPSEDKTPITVPTPTPSKPRPKKSRSEPKTSSSASSDHHPKPKKTSAKTEALDARKKQALQHKLENMMTKHKDLLKKDILKKRAQLEKELQVEIHKELSLARLQLQLLEKNKPESALPSQIISPRKKKTVSESSASQVSVGGVPLTDASHLVHASPPPDPHHHHHSAGLPAHHHAPSAAAHIPGSKGGMGMPVSGHQPSMKSPSGIKSSSKSSSSKKSSKNKNKKIVCICRTLFDDTKFYVGCDLCGNWFHGDCVGITEAMSRSMTDYVCDDCTNAKLNKELFCFCRQPYDETQFYICCEQCEDWYHGKCVGIMQTEADDIDDYICPKCDSSNVWNFPCQKNLSPKDYSELKKVTKTLIQHKNAWPFLEPVDPSEVPDYYKVVKEPMDLKTVEKRVEEKSYQQLAQFIGDVMLVFDNCRLYNPPNSSFCSCAATLETFFCQKLRVLKQRLAQKPQPPPPPQQQ